VAVTLCNNATIVGFDIDTTGYIECCPSFADIEGYSEIDSQVCTIYIIQWLIFNRLL
jgi:hypothetical protein